MWIDPYNSSQMPINPSGWGTKSPDPKSLKETRFRESLNKISQPKLPVSGKTKEERFWRALRQPISPKCQGFWSSHPLYKNLLVPIKMSWRRRRLWDEIWLVWSRTPNKHTGRRVGLGSLPCRVYSRAGHSKRTQVRLAKNISCLSSPLQTARAWNLPFHLRRAHHSLPKTNQPLTFPGF